MGLNSTSAAYGFGSFGSTYLKGNGKLNLSGATAKYYICAITIIEDATFEDIEMVDQGVGMGMPDTCFVSDDSVTVDDRWGAVTSQMNDYTLPVSTSDEFPAGITLYGMWDNVELNSGACVVYVAPRPDYRNRAAKLEA